MSRSLSMLAFRLRERKGRQNGKMKEMLTENMSDVGGYSVKKDGSGAAGRNVGGASQRDDGPGTAKQTYNKLASILKKGVIDAGRFTKAKDTSDEIAV
jgi:hypothetical protein